MPESSCFFQIQTLVLSQPGQASAARPAQELFRLSRFSEVSIVVAAPCIRGCCLCEKDDTFLWTGAPLRSIYTSSIASIGQMHWN